MNNSIVDSRLHVDKCSYSGPHAAKQAFIFLHGFPGLYTRNEDLASYATAFLEADCYIPHFPGIAKSAGEFLFSTSITSSISLVGQLISSKSYERVNLVGHSWGGFVALTILRHFKTEISKTLLLSSFTIDPPVEMMLQDLEIFVKQQQLNGKIANLGRLVSDIHSVMQSDHPYLDLPLAQTKKENLLIIQALSDRVMPAVANRQRYEKIGEAGIYLELDDNHWFTNRETIFKHFENFFSLRAR